MKKTVFLALRNTVAILLLVAGVAGILLPIIPGFPLILAAAFIADFPKKKRLLSEFQSRFNKLKKRAIS